VNDLFKSDFWKAGITQFIGFLIFIAIVFVCMKGWIIWQNRFGAASKRLRRDDE